MSRLGDLYKAMETLRKGGLSLNEDLERQGKPSVTPVFTD